MHSAWFPSSSPTPPLLLPAGEMDAAASATSLGSAAFSASNDTEILARIRGGDRLAFAQLYSLHKKRIYSLCLRMVGDTAEAEDLTQEVFLQLLRKIATFRGSSSFSTWLHRMTVNIVLMHIRKKGLPLVSMEEAMDPAPDRGYGRSFGAPDMMLATSVDRLTLERAISSLPPGYHHILVLHDIEGYDHPEIASLLDCSIGNSKSQLHKARLKLRDALHSILPAEARGGRGHGH
jgi:RNA polymerase sigma-70 factor, ECF subfamily